MIDPQWIFLAIALLSPVLVWWGTFKYFSGRITQWIKNNDEWRDEISVRLKSMEEHFRKTDQAIVATKVSSLELEILRLRKWRHERADPYVSAMDAMNQRVQRIERVLNGKL